MPKRPPARHVAELLTHRLVLARRLPPPFQATRIYVSSEGGLKYLRPSLAEVDPVLTGLVGEVVRAGHVVWDIGANVGLFTFTAASAATGTGRVIAVEPDAWLASLLRRSARRLAGRPDRPRPPTRPRPAEVEVVPVAIGASTGLARFHIASRSRATSHLAGFGSSQTGGTRATLTVPTFTLDDLLAHLPAPDVIKIDVEGAERTVLGGGRRLLDEIRPTVICEVAPPNAEAVGELLRGHGYRIVDAEVPAAYRRPLTSAPWSTLAVPDRPAGHVGGAGQVGGAARGAAEPLARA